MILNSFNTTKLKNRYLILAFLLTDRIAAIVVGKNVLLKHSMVIFAIVYPQTKSKKVDSCIHITELDQNM